MIRVISSLSAASIVVLAATSIFSPSIAEVAVQSKSKCLKYGGKVKPNRGDASHPWLCSVPTQDSKCAKKLGKLAYFHPDYGKCRNISDDVADMDDEWMEMFDY